MKSETKKFWFFDDSLSNVGCRWAQARDKCVWIADDYATALENRGYKQC